MPANRAESKLFALALLPRLAWTAWTIHSGSWSDFSRYDDLFFPAMALSLLGRGPEILTHPPGYAFFLVPFMLFGPAGFAAARLLQPFLGAAMAPLTFRLGERLGLSEKASAAAGAWVALDPMLVFFSARGSTEIPFSLLVVAFFLVWTSAWRSGKPGTAAASGVVAGAASLTRGVLLPFGAVLALAAWLKRGEQPRWPALVAACGLCWAAVMAPWTIRNWLRHRAFIPVSVQAGWNLYEGMTLGLDEIERGRPAAMGREAQELGLTDPIAIDRHFGAKAAAEIAARPAGFLWLAARKAVKFWRPFPYPPHGLAARALAGVFNLLLFGCAALGLPTLLRLRGSVFLLAWAAHLTALHALFASDLRYRAPLHFAIAIAAGAGAAGLLHPRQGSSQ